MSEPFTKTFHVRWGDLDSNGHMKNTAYLDACVDVRMMYFAENGFPVRVFEELRFGPVVLRDEVDYFREMRLLEQVTVDFALASINDDGSRFRLRNQFFREDGQKVATVRSFGGWLDLRTRKLSPPPEQLGLVLANLQKTEDFETLAANAR